MKIRTLIITVLIPSIITLSVASAGVYSYGDRKIVIGNIRTYEVQNNESLIEIEREFGLGYNEIVDANPNLDPFVPGVGVSVKIPTFWILPDVSSSYTLTDERLREESIAYHGALSLKP